MCRTGAQTALVAISFGSQGQMSKVKVKCQILKLYLMM